MALYRGDGVVVVELQVVLARPHDLDGPPDLLREQRRFGDEIRLRLAAEAAAEQRHVADDVALVDAERRGDRLLRRLRFCTGAHAVTLPSRKSATATGGSIVACAWCGT